MFSFGTPKTATGFTLPTTSTGAAATTAASVLGAGDNKLQTNKPITNLFGTPSTAASTGFSLGAAIAKSTAAAAPTLSFSSSSTGFGLAPTTTTTTTASAGLQFNLGTAAAATASTAAATSTTTSFTPIFGTASTAPTLGVSLQSTKTTDSGLKLTASLTSAAASATSSSASGFSITASSSTTSLAGPTLATSSSTSIIPSTGQLTYTQLDDSISKWSIDLEELCKFFINQTKQLNAWDHLLLSNGQKISALNDTIQRVKQQQKQLDQELDFVHAQQNELDELSGPLDKQLAEVPVIDQNRFQMYQLSENIDSQLKQMSEDLKEVIEQLNDSNKEEDLTDPVIQVSKILNAHMNTLQWIDRNTSQITSHLDQISKVHELNKKNHLNL